MKPVRSEAAVPGLFAAVPVSWPVVVGILVAVGIGTAVYYNSLPQEERESLLEAISDRLVADRLTLAQKMAVEGGLAITNIGHYIRCAIVGGKSYVDKDTTDAICDVAKERGMLGGSIEGVESITQVDQIKVGTNMARVEKLIALKYWGSSVYNNWYSADLYQHTVTFVNSLPNGSFVGVVASDLDVLVFVSHLDDVVNQSYIANRIDRYGNFSNVWIARVDGSVTSKMYRIDRNGNVTESGLDANSVYFSYAPEAVPGPYTGYGNVGDYKLGSSGVPSGEIGQAVEQDGAWDLPGGDIPIDNYGDATPVSLGRAAIGIDGIAGTWPGDIAYPDNIALPDVASDTDKAIPDTTDQAKAISGEVDVPQEIADTPQLTGSFDQFLVPSWIKTRFPWCIPFDLGDAIDRLKSAGSNAPRWYLDFPLFGYHCVVDIDLSVFNDVMVYVRYGELLVFGISLLWLTREMIRW